MNRLSSKIMLLMAVVVLPLGLQAASVSYTADNSSIFPNPERGFITMLERTISESRPNCVKGRENYLTAHANNDKGSLILVLYYLDNYKNTATLPSKILNGFDEDMAVLRSYGMKCIVRFAYTKDVENETAVDAPLSIVQSHLNQYKSHWQNNADVIFVFQAGIIGAWGEWYYTSNYGNQSSKINTSRRQLIDTLLNTVPADRCIQLRTPLFKTGYIGNTNPLTAAEAYTGTPKARLGHHNDAFLYGADNMGTYSDTATQKPYLAQETLYVPIGGESDITDANQAATEASHDRTVAEMSRLHWTFIQSGYSETVTNMWRNNGTFDELNRNLGYRYQLLSGTYADEAAPGGKMSVKIQLKNVGYAPLYNYRPAYIVLKNGTNTYSVQLQSDPRTWLPNGVTTTINEQITLPSNISTGTYQLYLYLPDAYSSIASNPKYAVRFANADVWNSSTGMNSLNASVQVTGSANPGTDPTPDPEAVDLPGTLNKANVNSYSDDMTWYNTDYFDFGPTDAANLDRWAEWKVNLRCAKSYSVSAVVYAPESGSGHEFSLRLLDAGRDTVASYNTLRTWDVGTIDYTAAWDLSLLPVGTYTLLVRNVFPWAQPKLKSLTLGCECATPTEVIEPDYPADWSGARIFDCMGREVTDGGTLPHGIYLLVKDGKVRKVMH